MKILITGKNGQVGWELTRSLQGLGEVVSVGRKELDLSLSHLIRAYLDTADPDILVNPAAYTGVDRAESEADLAFSVNSESVKVMAQWCKDNDCLFVHYSTDYVFDGCASNRYSEEDVTSPLGVYGSSKLAGENYILQSKCHYLIFRTSWVYTSRGSNFLLSILRLAKERESLEIVSDQFGAPTSAELIAGVTSFCIKQSIVNLSQGLFQSDIFNLSAKGRASWFHFASDIVNGLKERGYSGIEVKNICPISSYDYPTVAERPFNSCLDVSKIESYFGLILPQWSECLSLVLDDIGSCE